MKLIKHPSPNYGLRRERTKIEFIILHYTAMSTKNSLDRLCDPAHEVSCHYLIDQGGLCYQLVDDNKRAWHAGKAYWQGYRDLNSRSLGIELVNLGNEIYPEALMKKLKSLLKHLISSYEISPQNVLGHSDIAPSRKSDPGEYFNWEELSNSGLALVPEVSSPTTCDKTFFLAHAERAGFDPDVSFEEILKTFRCRSRPNFRGAFDGYDCALMQKFADAFDIDDSSN